MYNHILDINGIGILKKHNKQHKIINIPNYNIYKLPKFKCTLYQSNYYDIINVYSNNINELNNYINCIVYYILGHDEYHYDVFEIINNSPYLINKIESKHEYSKDYHHISFEKKKFIL